MLKYSKPVIVREEEKPVATEEVKTSADIGGAEPVVLQQQQLPPKKEPVLLTQKAGFGAGWIILIIIGSKLIYNKFKFNSFLLGVRDDSVFLTILTHLYHTLFSIFKNSDFTSGCGSFNVFCAPEITYPSFFEEVFQRVKEVASSVSDPEVSSILTSLSQL